MAEDPGAQEFAKLYPGYPRAVSLEDQELLPEDLRRRPSLLGIAAVLAFIALPASFLFAGFEQSLDTALGFAIVTLLFLPLAWVVRLFLGRTVVEGWITPARILHAQTGVVGPKGARLTLTCLYVLNGNWREVTVEMDLDRPMPVQGEQPYVPEELLQGLSQRVLPILLQKDGSYLALSNRLGQPDIRSWQPPPSGQ